MHRKIVSEVTLRDRSKESITQVRNQNKKDRTRSRVHEIKSFFSGRISNDDIC
jgi:hypothetical protein